jgi:hypothetical protein
MLLLPNWICRYDYKCLNIPFRLYNNLPWVSVVARFYDPPTFDDVWPVGSRTLKHSPQVDLVEAAIRHPLQQVRSELEFPFPPLGPR